jgi:hypothetical protein
MEFVPQSITATGWVTGQQYRPVPGRIAAVHLTPAKVHLSPSKGRRMSYPPQQQPYYYPAPPPPAKKGLSGGMIFGIIAGVLALCLCGAAVVGVVLWQGGFFKAVAEGAAASELASAKAGDCITNPYEADTPKIVGCSDGNAHLLVKLVIDGKSRSEGGKACMERQNVSDYLFIAGSPGSTTGKTLCLGPNR